MVKGIRKRESSIIKKKHIRGLKISGGIGGGGQQRGGIGGIRGGGQQRGGIGGGIGGSIRGSTVLTWLYYRRLGC